MVIERFRAGAAPEIYRRARDRGRMMPDGLEYVSSWVDLEFKTCYQLMRTVDASLFAVWTDAWQDLVEFEIVTALKPPLGAMGLGIGAADEVPVMEDRQRVVAMHAPGARSVDLDAVVEPEEARNPVSMP